MFKDKSSSVGVHTVRRLMSEDDDVLLVNVGSGLTAAHIASLTHNSSTTIYAYGITSDRHQKYVNKQLEHFAVRCTAYHHHHHLFGRKQKTRNSSCNRHTGNTRLGS